MGYPAGVRLWIPLEMVQWRGYPGVGSLYGIPWRGPVEGAPWTGSPEGGSLVGVASTG